MILFFFIPKDEKIAKSRILCDEICIIEEHRLNDAINMINNRVKKVKNEWRDTSKLIKKAKKSHKNKDYKKSIFYSKKALNEAKMAMEQYKKQKDSYRFIE